MSLWRTIRGRDLVEITVRNIHTGYTYIVPAKAIDGIAIETSEGFPDIADKGKFIRLIFVADRDQLEELDCVIVAKEPEQRSEGA